MPTSGPTRPRSSRRARAPSRRRSRSRAPSRHTVPQGSGPSDARRRRYPLEMNDWRSYDLTAATYERVHAPRFAEPARDLAALAGVTAGARVLDVGTGTGVAAAIAAELGARALGVDRSTGMLEAARRAHPEIPFLAAEAIDLPFADGTFDVVIGDVRAGAFRQRPDGVVRVAARDEARRGGRVHHVDRRPRRVHRHVAGVGLDGGAQRPARAHARQGDPQPRPVHASRGDRGDPAGRGSSPRANGADGIRMALRPRRVPGRADGLGDRPVRPRDARRRRAGRRSSSGRGARSRSASPTPCTTRAM